jgi:hypothetical protein
MLDEKTRLKIALVGIAIGFVACTVKAFVATFPIVEFLAFVEGPVIAYIAGKSYTDGKDADATK